MAASNTIPNQRHITVTKEKADKQHLFTVNTLAAIDEAAGKLQSKGGFKLYMYLAKNQDKYELPLYSSDFCLWSGLSITAYRTAFEELVQEGYLILKEGSNTIYTFYDRSQTSSTDKNIVMIENDRGKVEDLKKIQEAIELGTW